MFYNKYTTTTGVKLHFLFVKELESVIERAQRKSTKNTSEKRHNTPPGPPCKQASVPPASLLRRFYKITTDLLHQRKT